MPDHAVSTDPAVQRELDRLWARGPGADMLGLDRITRLLARLGDPHLHLPPVFHVAGTNGKGSTCAFLRAALEAAGYRVHAYTSPHLVRFNERIRLAGKLIDDAALAPLLAEVNDVAEDIGASFFEITTAAAFLAFARTPADACVVEVGLGGRLDATNVIPAPAVCGIAVLGIDHQSFLGDTIEEIAGEKAGIAKRGVPLVTLAYPANVTVVIENSAAAAGALLHRADGAWRWHAEADGIVMDDDGGRVALPQPALPGAFQSANLALAAAMLRCQQELVVPEAAIAHAARQASWPARLQRLAPGPLTALLPHDTPAWLDGGHNLDAARALAAALPPLIGGRPLTLVIGMLANKDAAGYLATLAPHLASVIGVPVPGHEHHAPDALAATARSHDLRGDTAASLAAALALASHAEALLIGGSLYLAGEALALNDELPE